MPPRKRLTAVIKLQINAGAANPAPPVGPALGQHGVNIMEFCKAYNAQTAHENGRIIPVEITVFEDRSFTFITKTPPAAVLIKEALGLESGSGEPNKAKVGRLSQAQLRSIAEAKMPDLNARDVDEAMKVIEQERRDLLARLQTAQTQTQNGSAQASPVQATPRRHVASRRWASLWVRLVAPRDRLRRALTGLFARQTNPYVEILGVVAAVLGTRALLWWLGHLNMRELFNMSCDTGAFAHGCLRAITSSSSST